MEITEEQLKQMSPEQIRELQKKQCIFCRIIEGQVQSRKVYEDNKVIAILDINPANPGHVLLLPKEHYSIMPQMPEEDIAYMFVVIKQISHSLLKALQVDGTNVFIANGVVAGQKAPHFMVHIIPRKEGDGVPLALPSQGISSVELEKIRMHIKKKMSRVFGLPDLPESGPETLVLPAAGEIGEEKEETIKEAQIVKEETRLAMQSKLARAQPINIDAVSKLFLEPKTGMSAQAQKAQAEEDEKEEETEEYDRSEEEKEEEETEEYDRSEEEKEEEEISEEETLEISEEDKKPIGAGTKQLSGRFDFDDLVSAMASSPHPPGPLVAPRVPEPSKVTSKKEDIHPDRAVIAKDKSTDEGIFVASRKSDRYHEPWCPFAVKVSRANKIVFKSKEDAESAGKEPCECVRSF